jgi:hypothetical protein
VTESFLPKYVYSSFQEINSYLVLFRHSLSFSAYIFTIGIQINSSAMVIASAYRTEDPGFEPRQGVRFLGIYRLQCCCQNLIRIVVVVVVVVVCI